MSISAASTRLGEPAWPTGLKRYRPLQLLGKGGMGVVYRARDEADGSMVAVKIVALGSSREVEALQREVYALGRLDHPGVVSVLDQGVEDGRPWYAMSLVEGRSLADELQGGAPMAAVLPWVRDLCATLAYVHGEGVVHRDLKPANLVVEDGGHATLIDFGLACRFVAREGREAIEVGGSFGGTYRYAAPEQLNGDFVDARTDLYAVGCILYEALVGAPPFTGAMSQVIAGHFFGEPIPPSELVEAVDPGLERLVLGLLAKRPAERPGYAWEIVEELDELGVRAEAREVRGRPYFYRPRFVGRGRLLDDARARIDRASDGAGGCVVVRGESGIGKTRFAMELTRLAARETLVVVGECAPDAAPLAPWRPLLVAIARWAEHDRAGREVVTRERAATLADVEPAFARLAEGIEAPPLLGVAARERLLEAFASTVRAFVREQSAVVFLDDLQWADELTCAALEVLLRGGLDTRSLLVVATCRAEEEGPALRALVAREGVHAVTLAPMQEPSIAAMVGDMLALATPPSRLVSFVRAQAEGNPFFVAEYLHEAVDAGLLLRDRGHDWRVSDGFAEQAARELGIGTPAGVRALVERRLARLSAPAQRMARAGAALGRVFAPRIAQRALEMDDASRLEAIRELMRVHVLEEDARGGVRFTHDKLREVAYVGLEGESRRALHGRLARALEDVDGEEAAHDERHAALGHHYELAEEPQHAGRHHAIAGDAFLRRGAFAQAARHLRAAVRLDDALGGRADALERGRWHRMLGLTEFAVGELDRSIDETRAALDRLGVRVPSSRLGWARLALVEAARGLTRRAWRPKSDAAREGERSFAATQLAVSYYYDARLLPSAATVLLGVNAADDAGDGARIADAYSRLGFLMGVSGLRGAAERCFARAHQGGRDKGEPVAEALGLYMEAMYRVAIAEWQRARELGERASRLARDAGDLQESEVAETIAAHALFYEGRVDDARAAFEALHDSARRRENRQHIGWGLFLSARSLLASGEVEEALERLEEGYAQLRPLPDVVSLTMCEGSLGLAAMRAGRHARAREVALLVLDRLRAGQRPAVGQCVDGYAGVAEVLVELHRLDPTPESARAARRALLELRGFALLFPIGRPASLRVRALHALDRAPAEATRLLRAAEAEAQRLSMAHEAERARRALAR